MAKGVGGQGRTIGLRRTRASVSVRGNIAPWYLDISVEPGPSYANAEWAAVVCQPTGPGRREATESVGGMDTMDYLLQRAIARKVPRRTSYRASASPGHQVKVIVRYKCLGVTRKPNRAMRSPDYILWDCVPHCRILQ